MCQVVGAESTFIHDRREANDYGWPGGAAVLSLRLWGATFPLSDKRHPVAAPAALLTGKHQAQWPSPNVHPRLAWPVQTTSRAHRLRDVI
jgi:hypothetical protein